MIFLVCNLLLDMIFKPSVFDDDDDDDDDEFIDVKWLDQCVSIY